mgnify:CR=1 FL=1
MNVIYYYDTWSVCKDLSCLVRIERCFEIAKRLARRAHQPVETQHPVISLLDGGRHFLQRAVLREVRREQTKLRGLRIAIALAEIVEDIAQADARPVDRLHRHRHAGRRGHLPRDAVRDEAGDGRKVVGARDGDGLASAIRRISSIQKDGSSWIACNSRLRPSSSLM